MAEKYFSREQVIELLHKKRGDKTLEEFSLEIGLPRSSAVTLSRIFNRRDDPTQRVLEYLGMEKIKLYKKREGK